jgi:hypothetical protein
MIVLLLVATGYLAIRHHKGLVKVAAIALVAMAVEHELRRRHR